MLQLRNKDIKSRDKNKKDERDRGKCKDKNKDKEKGRDNAKEGNTKVVKGNDLEKRRKNIEITTRMMKKQEPLLS